jgi:hypothetical protein
MPTKNIFSYIFLLNTVIFDTVTFLTDKTIQKSQNSKGCFLTIFPL